MARGRRLLLPVEVSQKLRRNTFTYIPLPSHSLMATLNYLCPIAKTRCYGRSGEHNGGWGALMVSANHVISKLPEGDLCLPFHLAYASSFSTALSLSLKQSGLSYAVTSRSFVEFPALVPSFPTPPHPPPSPSNPPAQLSWCRDNTVFFCCVRIHRGQ